MSTIQNLSSAPANFYNSAQERASRDTSDGLFNLVRGRAIHLLSQDAPNFLQKLEGRVETFARPLFAAFDTVWQGGLAVVSTFASVLGTLPRMSKKMAWAQHEFCNWTLAEDMASAAMQSALRTALALGQLLRLDFIRETALENWNYYMPKSTDPAPAQTSTEGSRTSADSDARSSEVQSPSDSSSSSESRQQGEVVDDSEKLPIEKLFLDTSDKSRKVDSDDDSVEHHEAAINVDDLDDDSDGELPIVVLKPDPVEVSKPGDDKKTTIDEAQNSKKSSKSKKKRRKKTAIVESENSKKSKKSKKRRRKKKEPQDLSQTAPGRLDFASIRRTKSNLASQQVQNALKVLSARGKPGDGASSSSDK